MSKLHGSSHLGISIYESFRQSFSIYQWIWRVQFGFCRSFVHRVCNSVDASSKSVRCFLRFFVCIRFYLKVQSTSRTGNIRFPQTPVSMTIWFIYQQNAACGVAWADIKTVEREFRSGSRCCFFSIFVLKVHQLVTYASNLIILMMLSSNRRYLVTRTFLVFPVICPPSTVSPFELVWISTYPNDLNVCYLFPGLPTQ